MIKEFHMQTFLTIKETSFYQNLDETAHSHPEANFYNNPGMDQYRWMKISKITLFPTEGFSKGSGG